MDFNKGALIETDSRAITSSTVIRLVDVSPPNQAIIRLQRRWRRPLRRRHGRQVELRKVRQVLLLLILLVLQSELEALGADNKKYVFSVDQYGHQRKSGSHWRKHKWQHEWTSRWVWGSKRWVPWRTSGWGWWRLFTSTSTTAIWTKPCC